jgi:hypothetical protein
MKMTYDTKCGKCDCIIREHSKRAIWEGNMVVCSTCYDELRYIESSGYEPVVGFAENKKATQETEIEHLKNLVRHYHGLWEPMEKEIEYLRGELRKFGY